MPNVSFPVEKNYFLIFKKYLKRFGLTIAEFHAIWIGIGAAWLGEPKGLISAVFMFLLTGRAGIEKLRSRRDSQVLKKLGEHLADTRKNIAYYVGSAVAVEVLELILKYGLL